MVSINNGLPYFPEYKLSDRNFSYGTLAQNCLKYLLHDDFQQTTSSSLEEFNERRETFAFLDYAAGLWDLHAARCWPIPENVLILAKKLLDPLNQRWLSYSEASEVGFNDFFENFTAKFCNSYPNPLYFASRWGNVDCIRFLIDEWQEDTNHLGGLYGSPLNAAIAHGHEDAVNLLIEKGASIYLNGGIYGTVIDTAAATGQVGLLSSLLKRQPDISKKGGWYGEPPLVAACRNDRKTVESIVKMLLDRGASYKATDKSGFNTVNRFASIGATNVLEILSDRGIDLNCPSRTGVTPLMDAINDVHHDTVEFLISKGANVNIRDRRGDSALHYAMYFDQINLIELLLGKGVDVNVAGLQQNTPLHLACLIGRSNKTISMLLEHGADHTQVNEDGETALHVAAEGEYWDAVDILLVHGANVNAQTSKGMTPLHIVKGKSARLAHMIEENDLIADIIDLLLEYGADPN